MSVCKTKLTGKPIDMNFSNPNLSCFSLVLGLCFSTFSGFAQCNAQFDFGSNDTICVGTTLQLTDQSFSPNGIGSWQWVVDGNPLSSVISTAEYTPQEEGSIEIELTVFDGQAVCSDQTSKTIVVLGDPDYEENHTDISCYGLCDGTAQIIFDSENAAAYAATWQSTLLTDPLQDLCEGTYIAEITDVLGCTSAGTTVEVEIDEPPLLEAVIANGEVIFACPSEPGITLNLIATGGTPFGPAPYQYAWLPSSGLSQVAVEDPVLTPSAGNMNQTYSVTVTDANGCEATALVDLKPTPSDVEGNITVNGQPCIGCDVYFYKPRAGEWERLQPSTTNGDGVYTISSVPGLSEFRLMVDPNEDLYPDAVQTFYGVSQSTHSWQGAEELSSGCGTLVQKNIEVITPPELSGQCTFRGRLFGNIGTNKVETEDPIPLIDVVVEKTPPGTAQAKATTNADGEFEFNFIPASDTIYTLYVNIPGIPMSNTHTIQVDPQDVMYDGLDLCVSPDTTFIARCSDLISVESIEAEESKNPFVYPNPSNGNLTVASGLFENERTTMSLFDASGRLAQRWELEDAPNEIPISGLKKGFYILQLMNESDNHAIRISVVD